LPAARAPRAAHCAAARAVSAGLPLDEQLVVYAARLVRIKAVLERVLQPLDAEMPGAAVIGPVEERTVVLTV
jgi:hypothetical protein